MNKLRFQALRDAVNRPTNSFHVEEKKSTLFESHVFTKKAMRTFLTKQAFLEVDEAIEKGTKITRAVSDHVAASMKDWAMSMGATHYTHWFQPLTGATAEKHDAFFDIDANGEGLEHFDGSQLVQQEPDASSFPNGGIRNTFEARGYTAWDPSSPAFIYDTTLCIPTIFVSYTGEALDNKTPLLRALSAVDVAATQVAKYFDKNVTRVQATLGWEQEYFLVDKALASTRPDIMLAGRALVGHPPPKGQQLDDHYFGSIPNRAINFMRELEYNSMLLGIPVKTRHNEVAPNQFELAPIFEEANLAVDHNALLMDIMGKIASKHQFKVLLHEKPFSGINGSGKHNNWSLLTNTGVNLLSPGKTPMSNLQFLTFFITTIKAVQNYESLIRSSIASAGNDHRLGGNEAPPAIISVFIGSQLSAVLSDLENVSKGKLSPQEKTDLKLNVVGKIPEILLDNTDRNRTSPFAFTGNKFEFRAVGSNQNCAIPMTVLNTIVAKQLIDFKKEVDALIKSKKLKKDDAIFNVLREYIKNTKNILFDGDGYSDSWQKEAARRGLSNLKTTPEALRIRLDETVINLFDSMGVMNPVEQKARYEIQMEQYVQRIEIESLILENLVNDQILPASFKYQHMLIQNVEGLKHIYEKNFSKHAHVALGSIEKISALLDALNSSCDDLRDARTKANSMSKLDDKAQMYASNVLPIFDTIRKAADGLELIIDDSSWPLAKFRELLFLR
ncbi:MAG: glutamine synthetase III [Flavobacteriaceae bacterium]|nr:glutamine synthetase III [Flavobacteriaceae bacterium]